jgi:hypothetical protein
VGQPLALNAEDAVAIKLGARAPLVTVEFVSAADCVALHCAAPSELGGDSALLRHHVAGAATAGCAWWRRPEGELLLGLTLVGPELTASMLLEAAGRLGRACRLLRQEGEGRGLSW